jgi:hypothetical protein
MNTSGDAAEQVVRMSLEGVEVAARITGRGAEQLGMKLYAVLKEEQKTKGKARLTSMLKSGKELKVYTITQKDLKKFTQEAKRYGVLYCVLKDRKNTDPNAAVDIIARAEDASKIQRITERFRLATVDRASVSLDIQRDRDKMFPKESVRENLRGPAPQAVDEMQPAPERVLPPRDETEHEGRSVVVGTKQEEPQINPTLAKTGRDPLSEPSSTQVSRSNGFHGITDRPSVREKLQVYRAEVARDKAERAKDAVSKGMETAAKAVKAVIPGKER